MKTDKYLKIVLTVIAVCLVVLTLQNLNIIPEANADQPNSPTPGYAMAPLSPDGTVEVRIKSIDGVLDINLQKVGGSTCYQGVPVVERK
jgi:hypothetical protein